MCAAAASGYVLSRGLSGISAISFRSAKSSGALRNFTDPAHKRITAAMLVFFIIASSAAMTVILPVQGISAIAAAFLVLAYHRYASYRDFGGITGDLCGWFLQICELMILAAIVFSERIMAL
jgi:adenosylcobinamide-GDP ribazoletransferase